MKRIAFVAVSLLIVIMLSITVGAQGGSSDLRSVQSDLTASPPNELTNALVNVEGATQSLQLALETNSSDTAAISEALMMLQSAVLILQTEKDNYIAADEALMAKVEAKIDAVVEAAKEAAIEAATALIESSLGDLEDAIAQKANAADVSEKLDELATAIAALENVKNDYTAADEALNSKLQADIDTAKSEAIAAADDLVKNAKNALQATIDQKANAADVSEKLDELTDAIAALEAAKNNYVTADEDLKLELEIAIAEAQAAAVTSAGELVKNAKKELQAAIDQKADTADVTAALDTLEDAIAVLEAAKNNYVTADEALKAELEAAIAKAKAEAVEIAKSFSPYIGENGNWWIGDVDTGESANGIPGVGIAKIEKTATSGNIDTYTITLTNGQTHTFAVLNGTNGQNGQNGNNGQNGKNGKDGVTPQLRVNPETQEWEISYDNGENWASLGASASVAQEADTPQSAKGVEDLTQEEMLIPILIIGASLTVSSSILCLWALSRKKKRALKASTPTL